MDKKTVLIAGSKGKMGLSIIENLKKFGDFNILGFDKGDQFPKEEINFLIDFSSIEGVLNNIKIAKERKIPFLTGVTGFNSDQIEFIKSCGEEIPVLLDFNMSLGINTIASILSNLTKKLLGYDIEIIETHHRYKKDAPSGTAIKLFNEIKKVKNFTPVYGREGFSLRDQNELTIHAVRGGAVFGEHNIRFLGDFEEVSISHRAFSRDNFSIGAIKGAIWLSEQKKGFYTMENYLKTLIEG